MKLTSIAIYPIETGKFEGLITNLRGVGGNNIPFPLRLKDSTGLVLNASQLQRRPAQPELNGPLKMLH